METRASYLLVGTFVLAFARDLLLNLGASEVRSCALLDKPARRAVAAPLDFLDK